MSSLEDASDGGGALTCGRRLRMEPSLAPRGLPLALGIRVVLTGGCSTGASVGYVSSTGASIFTGTS